MRSQSHSKIPNECDRAFGDVKQKCDRPLILRYHSGCDRNIYSCYCKSSDRSITTYNYDSAGRRIKETDAKGNITEYKYDKLGRAHKVIFADDTFSQTQFDTLGRRVKSIDQEGIVTQYQYDNLGRLVAVVQTVTVEEEKKEIKTQYRYDEIGRLIEVEDANHHIIKYEYDLAGRRVAVILPEGQRSQTTYDDLGNIETYTDFNKEVTDYDYNDDNRLEKKDLAEDTDITYTYTDEGQIETITDSRGTTTFGYDEWGYLRSRQDPEGPYLESGNTIEYDYDDMGNIVEVRTASGTVEYKYDSWNRLHEVIEGDDKTVYRYDEVGNLVRTEFPNQTVETRTYDDLYRLTNVQVVDSDEKILAQFDYELNDAGHRVQVTEKLLDSDGELIERTVDYDYDELYRLIEAAVWGGETITYGYDNAGNRITAGEISYVYDDNDRLIQEREGGEVVVEYKYDDNGNLIERRQQGTPTIEYVWDDQNRLVKVVEDGEVVEYEYDDDNIRVSQTVGGEKTSFLLDKNRPYDQVLAEFVDGEEVASYVYGLDLISQERNGEDWFYFVDGLGSTRGLTDSSGEVTDAYWYDAYGNLVDRVGNSENDYLFAGEQFDEVLGQYYLRQRYYDPAIGRFTRRDTWEGNRTNPITLNKYLYANGNPVNGIDPSGFQTLELSVSFALRDALLAIAVIGIGVAALIGKQNNGVNDLIFSIKGPQLGGNAKKLAQHLARLLRLEEVGGMPPDEDPDPGEDNDEHWWVEIEAFLKNIKQALKGTKGKTASRKQALRELEKQGITQENVVDIERRLLEAAKKMKRPKPDFIEPK